MESVRQSVLRVGLIGLDTSHVPAFTKNLNTPAEADHVGGAQVVAGYPGGSPDFELSIGRVQKFTDEIREKFGVKILQSPEAVAEACDLVFITAVDGRVHLDYLKRIAKFGRPTFIDKPLAVTSADAKELFAVAERGGFPLMSCSSLRYADALTDSLQADPSPIFGCDIIGPMAIEPTQPGFFWYGIHTVEIANRVLGPGCRKVQVMSNDGFDVLSAEWNDGRLVTIRGHRKGHKNFGVVLHREKESQFIDLTKARRSNYANMLAAIIGSLSKGKSDITTADTLEIIRIIEAANISRENGETVNV